MSKRCSRKPFFILKKREKNADLLPTKINLLVDTMKHHLLSPALECQDTFAPVQIARLLLSEGK
jgi:hypothetical protein